MAGIDQDVAEGGLRREKIYIDAEARTIDEDTVFHTEDQTTSEEDIGWTGPAASIVSESVNNKDDGESSQDWHKEWDSGIQLDLAGQEPSPSGFLEAPKKNIGNWDDTQSAQYNAKGEVDEGRGGVCRPRPAKQDALWTAPLTGPAQDIEYLLLKISSDEYPLLTAFLCPSRQVDLPFPIRHQLMIYILTTMQKSCFDFVLRNFPDHLLYTRIICYDQIDIFDWTAFIKASQKPMISGSSCTRIADIMQGLVPQQWALLDLRHWPDTSILDKPGVLTVGDIRMAVIHRKTDYDSRLILHAVCLLHVLSDKDRLHDLELILEWLYQDQCQKKGIEVTLEPLFVDQGAKVTEWLNSGSSQCTTQQQMLSRIQTVLEKSVYRFVNAQNPQSLSEQSITCAEQTELPDWLYKAPHDLIKHCLALEDRGPFDDCLRRATSLRNLASHPETWSKRHLDAIEDAKQVLKYVSDEETIAYVSDLVEHGLVQMAQLRSQRLAEYSLDAFGLQELYTHVLNAGERYSLEVRQGRPCMSNHEANVYNLYQTAAEKVYEMYKEAAAAADEDGRGNVDGEGDDIEEAEGSEDEHAREDDDNEEERESAELSRNSGEEEGSEIQQSGEDAGHADILGRHFQTGFTGHLPHAESGDTPW